MTNDALASLSYLAKDNWKLLLLAFVLIASGIGLWIWGGGTNFTPPAAVEGEVLRFGAYSSYEGDHPLVVVRTGDGRVFELPLGRATVENCLRGSRIRLVSRGDTLTVDPRGCLPPAS